MRADWRTILVYEYATGGGAWHDLYDPSLVADLAREGCAMASALTDDLRQAGFQVWCPGLTRLPWGEYRVGESPPGDEARDLFDRACREADAVWLIAPECRGILAQLAEHAVACDAMLLSPDPAFIRLTSDKHATAERLREYGVPALRGMRCAGPACVTPPWTGPSVCKPIDGAGSDRVARHSGEVRLAEGTWRVEPWVAGMAASVAVVCRGADRFPLCPCAQRLGGASGFQYLGGSLPLPPDLAQRARTRALQALQALPTTFGYVGIDLVLGKEPSQDVVIEVNPRLTSSYLGLRQAIPGLAAAIIDALSGASPLFQRNGRTVHFNAS